MSTPQMSLKQATLNQGSFTPVIYTPQTADMNILQRSLAQIEARQEKAAEQQGAVDVALTGIEANLNAAEIPWFTNYKQQIKQQIQNEVDRGDYGNAIRMATRLAKSVPSDTQIQNRIKYNADRNKKIEAVQKDGTLDALTKEMFEDLNYYDYEHDQKGEYDLKFKPVADISIPKLHALAAELTSAEQGGDTTENIGQTLITENGATTEDITKAIGVGTTVATVRGNTFAKKDPEKMQRVFNRLRSDSTITAGLNQKFETYRWAYEDRLKKSQDESLSEEVRAKYAREANAYKAEITDDDGLVYTDYMTWTVNRILPQFKDMGIDNRTTTKKDSTTYGSAYFDEQKAKRRAQEAQAAANANAADATVTEETVGTQGSPIEMNYQYTGTAWQAEFFDEYFPSNK